MLDRLGDVRILSVRWPKWRRFRIPPHRWDPERIRRDIEAGLVSPKAAEGNYGWRE